MRWLEIAPGFACNCRCSGCFSCSSDAAAQMSWEEVQRWLLHARRQGARHLWLSGGEPTIRRDFLRTLRAARHLGFERIKVQSNGMMFAYDGFAARAVEAGMNEVNLLLKSLDPKVHDALNRTPGSFSLLWRGLDHLHQLQATGTGLRLEGDFLMTTRNFQELPAHIDAYVARGLVHFNVWLFSLVDQGERDLHRLVPRITEAMPYIVEASDRARAAGASVVSLNTPACMVPPSHWDILFDPAGMDLLVVNPGGHAFPLEQSSIELGEFLPACSGCAVRAACHGVRADYLRVHGADEVRAVTAETAALGDPRGSTLDL